MVCVDIATEWRPNSKAGCDHRVDAGEPDVDVADLRRRVNGLNQRGSGESTRGRIFSGDLQRVDCLHRYFPTVRLLLSAQW